MNTPAGAHLVTDPETLVAHYSDLPGAHLYALVDLEEPLWSLGWWYRRGNGVVGLVAMPDSDWLAVYAVATTDPKASMDLLVEMAPAFAPGQFITGPLGLGEALGRVREVVWAKPHVRYLLTDAASIPEPDARVVPLGVEHTDVVARLYSEPDSAFVLPYMLRDNGFVGVFDGDRLVAAAGTHVVSESKRVAAIGAVYTTPSRRGEGLGRAVTAGVVHRMAGRAAVIGLNVADDNTVARGLYESLGFEAIHTYEEAELA